MGNVFNDSLSNHLTSDSWVLNDAITVLDRFLISTVHLPTYNDGGDDVNGNKDQDNDHQDQNPFRRLFVVVLLFLFAWNDKVKFSSKIPINKVFQVEFIVIEVKMRTLTFYCKLWILLDDKNVLLLVKCHKRLFCLPRLMDWFMPKDKIFCYFS